MTKPRIFITGGSGMLGTVLIRHFEGLGYRIIAPSREEFNLPNPAGEFPSSDVVIHCAAVTDVNYCEMNQVLCRNINVAGTERVVDFTRQSNATLFYISTPMVFSGKKGNYREYDRTAPINFYGRTKRLGERAVLRYQRGVVIRANPIGVRPAGSFPSFIQWFVDAAESNRSFDLFSDVRANPVSTETFADVLAKLIRRPKFDRILHIGSRDVAAKAEIWQHIIKHFPNFSGTVRLKSVDETSAGKTTPRPKEMWLNVDLIQKKYGIPMPAWRGEVDKVLQVLL